MKGRLEVRLSEEDKRTVIAKAKACGLSQSEYIRKRVLGYEPRAAPSDALYDFTAKLIELSERPGSPETEEKILALLDTIRAQCFTAGKE